jgi:membrane associated rhomboid family serine protease
MSYYSQKRQVLGLEINALLIIIVLNLLLSIVLFFLQVVIQGRPNNTFNIYEQLSLINQGQAVSLHSWSILTHAFTNIGLSVIANMLWLWTFGFIVQDFIGSRHIWALYLFTALLTGLLFLLFTALGGSISQGHLVGSNVCTAAICIVACYISPNYRFFPMLNGGIPLWIVGVAFFIIQMFYSYAFGVAPLLCLLAACSFGFIYIYTLRKKGVDFSNILFGPIAWFKNLIEPAAPVQKGRVRYINENSRNLVKKPKNTQAMLDAILDKINEKGLDSLTSEEREFLKKASKNDF